MSYTANENESPVDFQIDPKAAFYSEVYNGEHGDAFSSNKLNYIANHSGSVSQRVAATHVLNSRGLEVSRNEQAYLGQ